MQWAEFKERQITIRCVGFDDAEIRTLHEDLKLFEEIEAVRIPLNESIHDIDAGVLYVVLTAGALVGKKVLEKGVDILNDRITKWLANHKTKDGAEVHIYGADGKVVKTVRKKK